MKALKERFKVLKVQFSEVLSKIEITRHGFKTLP